MQASSQPSIFLMEIAGKTNQPNPGQTEIVQEMAEPAAIVETESPVVVTTAIQPEVVEPLQPTSVPADVAEVQATPQPLAEEAPLIEVAIVEQISESVVEPVATRSQTPAGLFGTSQQERVVAALATTPTIDEASDTVVVSSVAAIEPVPLPVGSSAPASGAKGKLLPLRSVLADYTELKASPTNQSKTLLSLGKAWQVDTYRHQ